MTIRSLTSGDIAAAQTLWNQCLPQDALDMREFGKRILYDVNFDPELYLLAEEGGLLAGFCYLTLRRVPDEIAGLEPGKAYLVAMGVRPGCMRKGAGKALIEWAHTLLKNRGVTTVAVCCYANNYFCPGVDAAAYPEGVPFLESMGYEARGECVSMALNLHGFVYPRKYLEKKAALCAQGYRFAPFTPADTLALYAFMRAEFAHWLPNVRQALAEGRGEDALLLAHAPNGEVIGFVLRAMDGCPERFGPFGVSNAMQGGGIGTVLFHEMMQSMVEKHIFYTHFLWTGGRNIDIYSTWGMHVYRTYTLMNATL